MDWRYTAVMVLLQPIWAGADVSLSSPDGNVVATISVNPAGRLQYNLTRGGLTVLDDSLLGITVDGIDLGTGVTSISGSSPVEVNSTCPHRGVKAIATDHYREIILNVQRSGGGDSQFAMTWRAYNDGVAYRYQIPGTGSRTVNGETSQWALPAGTTMWLQFGVDYYEAVYRPVQAGTVWSVFGSPVTCILPTTGGYAGGYAAIMEGALYDYSGMILEPVNGTRVLRAKHLENSWSVQGGTSTPWRITLAVADLNALVNSTVVSNVNPEPSAELAEADWIKPGRAVWSWWLNDVTRYEDQVPYMDAAVQLGFEYTLWDEKWEYWSQPDLDYLLDYARNRNLQVWLWKRYQTLDDQSERDTFFAWIDAKNAALGRKIIAGVKIDFMNAEPASIVRWYEKVLQHAASHQLMLNFHGANKPTGTSRTYPNEMTREGIRGLEYNSWGEYLPPSHNAALPFTRLLGGHADYTPVTFMASRLGSTTFAHQLAMAFVLTSPLTHWADHPSRYLSSPALEVIKASPTVWDETIVLDGSQIGDLVMMARRSGTRWFLSIVSGDATTAKTLSVPLSFLANGTYEAIQLSDMSSTAAGMNRVISTVTRDQSLPVWLRPGGGFVGMFTAASPFPVISRSPAALNPSCEQGSNSVSQTFTVANGGSGTLNYSIAVDAGWLSVSPTSGSAAAETDIVTVNYATSALAAGTYQATITISDPGAVPAQETVLVTLTVSPAPPAPGDFDEDGDVDQKDFGHFQVCLSGAFVPQTEPGCQNTLMDVDDDVDQQDVEVFLRCLSGPGVQVNPDCAD